MTTEQTWINIYADLGYLFYSVAAGDGRVRKAELEQLLRIVNKHWLPLEDTVDAAGTDAAHYIGISFDHADAQELGAEEAFNRFRDGYRDRSSRYDAKMKELVLKTVKAIAEAFHGVNKEEEEMIARVKALLAE